MSLRNGYQHPYQLSRGGVDLYHDLLTIPPYRSPQTKNCFFRDGMVSRLGMSKLTSTEVLTANPVSTLHRFYYGTTSKQLLVASGTTVKAYDDVSAWTNVATGLTDDAQVTMHTWAPKDAAYIANGNEAPFKWNGSTKTNLTAFPTTTKQFIAILDRLAWIDNTNPSFIQYTTAFDDTVVEAAQNALKVPGPGVIHGLAYHGLITDVGFATKFIVAQGSSVWLLTANALTPASIDARLDIISENIGCEAWRTIQSTPIGTIFLGTDRQVYLITYDMRLWQIGSLIRSNRNELKGIEQIPSGQMDKPFAAYHDGFYKLFFPAQNGTYNTLQYWLDTTRFFQDKDTGRWGPWYGPMMGQSIAHAVVQNGPGDNGNMMAGQGNASTGSYVYRLDNTNADDGTAIQYIYQTNYDAHRRPQYNKTIVSVDIEYGAVDGTLNVGFYDSTGSQSTGETLSLESESVYWDELYWDDFYWSQAGEPTRQEIVPEEKIIVRYLSVVFDFSSTAERFELYSLMANGQIKSARPFVGSVARE